MKCDLKLIFFIVEWVLSWTLVSANDPCSTYNVFLADANRSAAYIQTLSPPVNLLCDATIDESWYRIDSPISNDLVTNCPDLYRCGTSFPLWMNGTIPHVQDGIVHRTVCTSGALTCCDNNLTIRVKNCGSYRVYYLKQAKGCPEAYCFGTTLETTTTSQSTTTADVTEVTAVLTTSGTTQDRNIDQTSLSGTTQEKTDVQTSKSDTQTPFFTQTSNANKPSTFETSVSEPVSTSSWPKTSKTTSLSGIRFTGLQNSEDDLTKILVICSTAVLLAIIVAVVVITLYRKRSKESPQKASCETNLAFSNVSGNDCYYYSDIKSENMVNEGKENEYETIKDRPEQSPYDKLQGADKITY